MAKIGETVKTGERILREAGIMNPEVDSRLLYCHVAEMDRGSLFLRERDEAAEDIEREFFCLIHQRAKRIPLQHITGSQNFMGLSFKVTPQVLIPRSETELLVETALKEIKSSSKEKISVLDLCTGSGAIGISVAKLGNEILREDESTSEIEVLCTDISRKAIEIARYNGEKLGVEVHFAQGDLFEPVLPEEKSFDMILSNPPYIESHVISTLQDEVKFHEPVLALDGGKDGLDLYRRILKSAPKFLNSGGVLIMEIGYNQKEALLSLIKNNKNYCESSCIQDFAGKDRIIFAKRID